MDLPTDSGEVIDFSHPYDQVYLFTNWLYCSRDVDFECRMRGHEQGILAGWHNFQLSVVPPVERARLYARHPSCWECNEYFRFLAVPTPLVLENYSNSVVNCRHGTDVLWNVNALKLVAMALLQFLL